MNLEIFPHTHFMQQAYQQAQAAAQIDEVPVGAVVVRDQQIIGAAHNPVSYTHLTLPTKA